ncbi:hypothetical protein [Bacillus paranthracis]|uniref:DUF2004 domain-containing protein n=1 Tax=Bacillus paranthracis TaxID=2026186 RepID=A0AAX3QPA2_9BACI|nr:hypothetical protein [Bacillus paranthracis]WES09764.1 hypothetical protein P3K65_28155 [Bacillus paranthracis]
MRDFDELVKHMVGIHVEPMPMILSSKDYYYEFIDALNHCLHDVYGDVKSDDYINYVREQLSDEEFATYEFESIREEVEKGIRYSFLSLIEDEVKEEIESIIKGSYFVSHDQFEKIKDLSFIYLENCGVSGTGKGVLYTVYLMDDEGNKTELEIQKFVLLD